MAVATLAPRMRMSGDLSDVTLDAEYTIEGVRFIVSDIIKNGADTFDIIKVGGPEGTTRVFSVKLEKYLVFYS
jgi:hypothetical protein